MKTAQTTAPGALRHSKTHRAKARERSQPTMEQIVARYTKIGDTLTIARPARYHIPALEAIERHADGSGRLTPQGFGRVLSELVDETNRLCGITPAQARDMARAETREARERLEQAEKNNVLCDLCGRRYGEHAADNVHGGGWCPDQSWYDDPVRRFTAAPAREEESQAANRFPAQEAAKTADPTAAGSEPDPQAG